MGHGVTFCLAAGVRAGARALEALCEAGYVPSLAVGYSHSLAARAGFATLRPITDRYRVRLVETDDINGDDVHAAVDDVKPALLVVAGWSQIVRAPLIEKFPLGAVGLHPTRLPEGRGRAPIPWTLIKGMTTTAVSLFHLEHEVDAGGLVAQYEIGVSRRDDAASLYEKVADTQAQILLDMLPYLLTGQASRRPQPPGGDVWPRRRPEDGLIDWSLRCADLYNWVRGLTRPYPGAFTFTRGKKLLIWSTDLLEGVGDPDAAPGTVVAPVWSTSEGGVLVAAGEGHLVLRRVQLEQDPETDALALFEDGALRVGETLG